MEPSDHIARFALSDMTGEKNKTFQLCQACLQNALAKIASAETESDVRRPVYRDDAFREIVAEIEAMQQKYPLSSSSVCEQPQYSPNDVLKIVKAVRDESRRDG